ncbi:hypothetical protein LZ012_13510 [Dechloromonas sp. XY25]|uniref:Uncharacterized protein n=1 Tax=Dechloromonas hankyongensis TaxID=2908002 RepID=A0ABS9K4C0_9RHOO|nr:hypothetical protein [Dechloromonas hankyongensis]MCG2578006.1 hypothetical protein [Dechloromonas hankyongensis]
MSATHFKNLRSQPANAAVGKGEAQSGQDEMSIFSLRDTLSGISVREANFSEFLAALRQQGMHAAKA